MKKIIITLLLCAGFIIPAAAQYTEENADPTLSRRGISLLPEAGDLALGIEATPFLDFLGNMLNSSGNSAPAFEGFNNTIYMKYFLESDVAIRAKLRLNLTNTKNKETVKDDYATILDPTNVAATTVDTRINGYKDFDLSLGYELRRGKGRVQGFYGGELLLGYSKNNYKYKYGNPITTSNQRPTTFYPGTAGVSQGYRFKSVKEGAAFGAGLGGFVGVEYFFTPQISLGGELGLGFTYNIKGQDEITTEGYLGTGVKEYKYRARDVYDTAFEAGIITKTAANIFLLFHF